MVRAIVETCVDKVANATPLRSQGLQQGSGRSYRTADGSVVVMDPTADYACQVVGSAEPGPVSEGLATWAEAAARYELVGSVPMSSRDRRGLYVYGVAPAGGYLQIHLTNLPDGRMGALITRSEVNRDARDRRTFQYDYS